MSKLANDSGYLELFIGPMFSGKTSKLLEIYKQYTFCNSEIIVVNHSSDNRYSDTMLSTHDKTMIPCVNTIKLMDLYKYSSILDVNIEKKNIVLINEGQFFQDLYEFVIQCLRENKKLYICGLDGDFRRKKFGQMLDLIPLCDKVTKLTSLCGICKNGTPGIFSLRLTNDSCQTLIGSDNYVPVCRSCYKENTWEENNEDINLEI
jgi:thymidine kinase